MIDEIKEILESLLEIIKQTFCNHEYECTSIDDGTLSEVNSWCKKCGKPTNW